MTLPSLLEKIAYLKSRSTILCAHEACTEVHWVIDNLPADLVREAAEHFKQPWFRCGDGIAILLWDRSGYHISLRSVPVKIREVFEFINESR